MQRSASCPSFGQSMFGETFGASTCRPIEFSTLKVYDLAGLRLMYKYLYSMLLVAHMSREKYRPKGKTVLIGA